jgi:hypothetical protein
MPIDLPSKPRLFVSKWHIAAGGLGLFALIAAVLVVFSAPRPELLQIQPPIDFPAYDAGPPAMVTFPGKALTAEIGEFTNELQGYAAGTRLQRYINAHHILLSLRHDGAVLLRVQLPNDLLRAVPFIETLRVQREITNSDWAVTDPAVLSRWRDQTEIFKQTYSGIEKAQVYPRNRAPQSVSDICAVADFYALPLRFFRSVGTATASPASAAHWSSQLRRSAVILLRAGRAWLTVDRNSVTWQDLQQPLQQAHALYRADERDYTRLAERLRPQTVLREELPPGVLLTYAGLLLRDLLDKTGGRESEAWEAYNIPPDDPNVRQDVGVRRASLYAGRLLRHAVDLNRIMVLSNIATPIVASE